MTISLLTSYLKKELPDLKPGDTVRVYQKIKEGDKERLALFEGIVIARKHGTGINATFTVRRMVGDIGVECIFPLHSPRIEKVKVVRRATKVRRAKLYYLREKAAREIRKKMKQVWQEDMVPPEEKKEETTEAAA